MKLIFTPNPTYIHKVLVTAYESGTLDRLSFERTRPFDEDTEIWRFNPLGKVPALELDNGKVLLGGLVICQFLDSLSTTGYTVFPDGDARWEAMRLMMVGDGMFDAITLVRVEGWRDKTDWNMDYMLRERRKVMNCLDMMDLEAPGFKDQPFHIGHICMAGALSYLELRNPIKEHGIVDGDETFDWRVGRPALSDWYDAILERPSIAYRVSVPDDQMSGKIPLPDDWSA